MEVGLVVDIELWNGMLIANYLITTLSQQTGSTKYIKLICIGIYNILSINYSTIGL